MNQIVNEKRYISAKTGIAYENLSQSYLRAETALGNQSVINWQIQAGKNVAPIVTERLLQLNDMFVITHITCGLKRTADPATDVDHLAANVYSWDNPTEFATFTIGSLAGYYNGSFSAEINRRVFIPEFPMRAFRRVPDTQLAQNAGALGYDSWPSGLYSFYPTDPTLIDGRQTITLQTQLNATLDFTGEEEKLFAVLEVRGYLVTNAKD